VEINGTNGIVDKKITGPLVIIDKSEFTMGDGMIITGGNDSTSTTSSGTAGGVKLLNNSIFTMKGGTIRENTGTNTATSGDAAGGVYVNSGSEFIMSGGRIEYNHGKANSNSAGGVYVASGTFTMTNGTIVNNDYYKPANATQVTDSMDVWNAGTWIWNSDGYHGTVEFYDGNQPQQP
jgi:hypothetical protein